MEIDDIKVYKTKYDDKSKDETQRNTNTKETHNFVKAFGTDVMAAWR